MRKILLAASVLVLGVGMLAGCGKSEKTDTIAPADATPFNMVQFYQDFSSAPPELKTLADKTMMSVQTASFKDALKLLGQLDANPALNPAQKKSVADVTAQVKKQMAKMSQPAAP